ncbi:DUF4394 domain-containing protein [Hymenobacter actinosclerus]|uniref:DUF4394 domain-containing protein n=1 Tax=Hymenobacter actinosclerus TaxID=82805 RepID=UPI000B83EB23|nr:DUF4394 domain-containing protein [Hymenobacter actinosclerus]
MTDKLYKKTPPNDGTLVEVGALGVDAEALNGYDIGGTSDTGYALLTVGGPTQLYTIDDKTGRARLSNDYRFGGAVSGFTIGLGF